MDRQSTQKLKTAIFVILGFVLATVAVFSLYISGFFFYYSFGGSAPHGDKLYSLLSEPEAEGVFQGEIQASNPTRLTSPTGKSCLLYQTVVVHWTEFYSSGSSSSTRSVSSQPVFKESDEAFGTYLSSSSGRILIDVTELDSSYLKVQSDQAPDLPSFVREKGRQPKFGFVAPEDKLKPDPRASDQWYEVKEDAFQEGQEVTAIGSISSQGYLSHHPALEKPVLLPGSKAQALKRIESRRKSGFITAFKALAVGLFSLFGLRKLWQKNKAP